MIDIGVKNSLSILEVLILTLLSSVLCSSFAFYENVELADIALMNYHKSLAAKESQDYETALTYIEEIPVIYSDKRFLALYLELLYQTGDFDNLSSIINSLPQNVLIYNFDMLVEYYLLAAVNLNDFAAIPEFIELQRRYFPEKIHDIYKHTLYSLLQSNNHNAVFELLDIFPVNIYDEGEKNFIYGLAYYNNSSYNTARAFFDNVLLSDNDKLKTEVYDYLSIIAYKTKTLLPESSYQFSQVGAFNYILSLLELYCSDKSQTAYLDEANALSHSLEPSREKTMASIIILWLSGHYRTAKSLLDSAPEIDMSKTAISSLIAGELLYYSGEYARAQESFKEHLAFDSADVAYANHSIALSFKNYFRYNNTAYYWLKNLEDSKTVYDSLASYNLALLYNFTENYDSANRYFNYYNSKYDLPARDINYITSYLNTLRHLNAFVKYRAVYDSNFDMLPLSEIKKGALLIGDNLFNQNKFEEAFSYYEIYLELNYDDNLVMKIERQKFLMGDYQDSEHFILSFIENHPESSFNQSLVNDLVKYYLGQKQFNKGLDFINSYTANDSTVVDSLRYYQAVAYNELGKKDEAIELLLNIHQLETNLSAIAYSLLVDIVVDLDTKAAIEILNGILERDGYSESVRDDYLMLLAKVYENAALYREANNIYSIFLDNLYDKTEIYYKLAVNEMYLKRYESALQYLDIINLIPDNSYQEETYFLSYLAHYSLSNHNQAVKYLLLLYDNYPGSEKRFEVIKNLITLFIEREQQLFAWYFLKEYYPFANNTQRFILDNYRNQLKKAVKNDSLVIYQINDYRNVIDKTLSILEQYEN